MLKVNHFLFEKILPIVVLIALGASVLTCKRNSRIKPDTGIKIPKIEEVLNSNDPNLIQLLKNVRGSVGRRGAGSKTIWSRKNDYELGLYVSANHVYGLSGWISRTAQFFDPSVENLGIFETSQIPPSTGSISLGNTLTADFPLMHFDISANATNTSLLPAEDFYLGVLDNQRTEQGPLVKHPNHVQISDPLQMYDPNYRTKSARTWNIPMVGEYAIAIGYPQDRANYPNGAVAYGKILSDTESVNRVLALKAVGDTEGDIPYNANVEFFVDAQAIPGMSGGGVFNADGQLLGIMVRASDKKEAPKIIRVVKMSHILHTMLTFYSGLSEANKHKIVPFIRGELNP
ncbi:S1 family peptidase [Pedobacter insulae]|uniref:Trypsin-like peptidase domain-containing protein n=1 Tax=Pedobacter insulae TaxID=414048 RepID=A0A1I2UTM1_9SPHI|nr:serine protease [Pedobacter insulae]SFG80462.1 Trypsin-like peptidase domain-containing protein [Pedobacter insulae]